MYLAHPCERLARLIRYPTECSRRQGHLHSDSTGSTYFTSLPDGTLISETNPSGTYYYLSEGQGSTAALTDSSGNLQNQYSYDPLGNMTSSTGSVANPITYQGGMYDSSTGFYYTGSGYYDPATGQNFGCKDKGSSDNFKSEDYCGEDEGTEHVRYLPAPDITRGHIHHPRLSGGYLLITFAFSGSGTVRVTVTAVAPPHHVVTALFGGFSVGLDGQAPVTCFKSDHLKQASMNHYSSTMSETCSVQLSGTGRAYISFDLHAEYCGGDPMASAAILTGTSSACVDSYGNGFPVPM